MKISIIMSVRNGEDYLQETMNSVLNQTEVDFEFLITDDGSTDSTVEMLQKYTQQDSRIKLFLYEESAGLAVRLNNMIKSAKGAYIARMDADDICVPTRLSQQVDFLQKHSNVAAVGGYAQVLGSNKLIKVPCDDAVIGDYMMFSPALIHPTVMFRSEVFDEHGVSYPPAPCAQDYGLWLLMRQKGLKLANMPKVLLEYRIHENSTTATSRNTVKQCVLEETMHKYMGSQVSSDLLKLNAAVAMGRKLSLREVLFDYSRLCVRIFAMCRTWSGKLYVAQRYIKACIKSL